YLPTQDERVLTAVRARFLLGHAAGCDGPGLDDFTVPDGVKSVVKINGRVAVGGDDGDLVAEFNGRIAAEPEGSVFVAAGVIRYGGEIADLGVGAGVVDRLESGVDGDAIGHGLADGGGPDDH